MLPYFLSTSLPVLGHGPSYARQSLSCLLHRGESNIGLLRRSRQCGYSERSSSGAGRAASTS